jgi:uroporphyrinogen-III synthase
LEERLGERGFMVERIDVYQTKPINARAISDELNKGIDAICFTSASIVDSLLQAVGDSKRLAEVIIASIGPATSAALRESGLEPTVEAYPHTAEGLVLALAKAVD